jgi:uncharacterized protein (DUF849 family)
MTLRDQGKVIIEVGLNETISRLQNPHVAYSPEEAAADAVACAAEGAAVIHWHARNADGTQDWVGEPSYRKAMELIGQACDAIVYPTYYGDLSHVWALDDRPPAGSRIEMAPFDVFQEVKNFRWDAARDELRPIVIEGADVAGTVSPPNLDEMQRRGLTPSIALFELGELRWAAHAARLGLIQGVPQLKIFVCGQYLKGAWPTVEGLRAFLSQWPAEIPAEITVVTMTMHDRGQCEEIIRAGIELGAHVRVGIGDNPDAWPDATNAELVRWAAREIRKAGLEPATPEEVRQSFRRQGGLVSSGRAQSAA